MSNKKSFFEKLTGSIKFNNDEDYEIYDEEFLEDSDDNEKTRKLTIESESEYEEQEFEEEVGELSVDMYRADNTIIIKTMVAGIQKSEIDITITRDMVVIEGSRKPENHGTVQVSYFQELYWGAFERTIELPEEVDIEMAEAQETHGLLTLILPLVDKNRQARLKIK